MSGFIVSKTHIDAMIQAGIKAGALATGGFTLRWRVGDIDAESVTDLRSYGLAVQEVTRELTRETADRVGAMLWNENKRSVDHRYNEVNDRDLYRYRPPSRDFSPVAILKAIDCYEYQSCEHPEWPASEAFAFCAALRKAMIRALPGYSEAPWGID